MAGCKKGWFYLFALFAAASVAQDDAEIQFFPSPFSSCEVNNCSFGHDNPAASNLNINLLFTIFCEQTCSIRKIFIPNLIVN